MTLSVMGGGSEYRYIIAEVIHAPHENSRHKVRVRPLPGQWAGLEYRIECPLDIRHVGKLYKLWAKFKDTSTAPQLYSSYHWKPERVTLEEAEAFIEAKCWRS